MRINACGIDLSIRKLDGIVDITFSKSAAGSKRRRELYKKLGKHSHAFGGPVGSDTEYTTTDFHSIEDAVKFLSNDENLSS